MGQFFGVRFDQPRAGLQRGAQGFSAGIEGDFQAEGIELFDQLAQPLRSDAARQTAGDHHSIVPRRDLQQAIKQRLLRTCINHRARAVDVGDAPVLLGDLDIATRLAGHADERVDKTTLGEQGFECLQIVFAEKAADGELMAEVRQHLGDVDALARSVGVHLFAAIDLTGIQPRQLNGEVECRVEGQGENLGHYRASTNARTSLALPTAKAC